MKKLLFSTVFLLGLSSVAWSQSAYHVKSSGGANLRQGPGKNYSVSSTLPEGAHVKVLEKKNDEWYKVEYDGKTGYVSATLLEQDPPQNNNQNNNPNSNQRPASDDNRSQNQTSHNDNQRNNSSSNRSHTSDNGGSNRQKSQRPSHRSGSGRSVNEYNWGIGLRLGDPLGITVKKYFSNGGALEFNLGRSTANLNGYNYSDGFYNFSQYSNQNYYFYYGYNVGFSTDLQVHYLVHKPIANADGLNWYFGGGAQLWFTPVTYYYYYDPNGDIKDHGWGWGSLQQDRRTNVNLGLDGVIGLEYTFKNAPISVFADATLYYRVLDNSGLGLQGGIGGRYNF